MSEKIKTIRRRKAWPKWARWYVAQSPEADVLGHGHGRCSRLKPVVSMARDHRENSGWNCRGPDWLVVSGPRLSRDWTKTLRRIVP